MVENAVPIIVDDGQESQPDNGSTQQAGTRPRRSAPAAPAFRPPTTGQPANTSGNGTNSSKPDTANQVSQAEKPVPPAGGANPVGDKPAPVGANGTTTNPTTPVTSANPTTDPAKTGDGKTKPATDDKAGDGKTGDDKDADGKPDLGNLDPSKLAQVLPQLLTPALSAASAIPSAFFTALGGLLSPLGAILSQFGQGSPSSTPTNGLPADLLSKIQGIDPSKTGSGSITGAYADDTTAQSSEATALDGLDKDLAAAVESSGANTKVSREKLQQIIQTVNQQVQALGPISNTVTGQARIVQVITEALSQAGVILSSATVKDGVNANSIKSMASKYTSTISASNSLTSATNTSGAPSVRSSGQYTKINGVPAKVEKWINYALDAKGITDPKARANWAKGMAVAGKRESGYQENIVNGWDSNAKKGTPSGGWLQFIKPTYDSNWQPGMPKSHMNPFGQGVAFINYAMGTYHVSADGSDLAAKIQQANPGRSAKGY